VLNLDSRVRLDEVELLALVQQEFDGGGVDVAGFSDNPQRGAAKLVPRILIEDGTR
jgi:hypothetical protein